MEDCSEFGNFVITLIWYLHTCFIFTAESKVLVRSIVFVNNSKICALPITYINFFSYATIAPDCGVGGTSTGAITHLVINVENDELYFTIDRVIYRQKMYQTPSTLYTAANQVTGKSIYKLGFYLPLRQCHNHKTMT